MLVTAILLVTGLAISSGLAKDTFGFLSETGKDDFIENYIVQNVKSACKTPGEQTIPRNKNFSYTLEGVKAIKIVYKHTVLDDFYTFRLKYGPDNTQKFRLDKDGSLSSFACSDSGGPKKYRINGSLQRDLDSGGETGKKISSGNSWIQLDKPDKPVRFRIIEKEEEKKVNIQVYQ
jgi:hypothetical protein